MKNGKRGKGFQTITGIISVVSIAIIAFAILWGNGYLNNLVGDEMGFSAENKIGPSPNRTETIKAFSGRAGYEKLSNKVDEELYMRGEEEWVRAESENLNLDRYLAYIDDRHPINQSYIDENFPVVSIINERGEEKQAERMALYYYLKLKKHLEEEEGIYVDLDYGYRSIKGQQEIIDKMTIEHGAEYAWYYAAVPGTSEHHTGLAIDLCLIVDGEVIDENVAMNAQTEIFGKIHEIMPEYGFVLNYPYESWHIRFVGSPEIAKAYYTAGRSFEAFCDWYKSTH